jgi:hypothetical protein
MLLPLLSDWRAMFALLAAIITVASILPYVRSMLAGSVRPDFVTWFIWALTSGIGVAAQYASGTSWSISVVIGNALATGIVAILALNYGIKRYSKVDTAALLLALCAIVLWAISSDPIIALTLAIAADFIAAVPTIVKAQKHPRSESPWTFFAFAGAAVLAIASSQNYDFANLAYPVYFLLIYIMIGSLALKRHRRKRHASAR